MIINNIILITVTKDYSVYKILLDQGRDAILLAYKCQNSNFNFLINIIVLTKTYAAAGMIILNLVSMNS
jgi:hypothetical protein